jgi:2-oxoglutarate ferredoxin oxidoreductase subunit gamma
MVGFFGAVANLLEADALRKAVDDSVPPAMRKLNLAAFEKGYEYGTQLLDRINRDGDDEAAVSTLEVG